MRETDKYTKGLIDFYNDFFKDIRDKPVTFLELGINVGGSLLYWSDYFKKIKVFGLDVQIPAIEVPNNVKMLKCDQSDVLGLTEIGQKYGLFDVVLDDCSHFKDPTQISFDALYPFVKEGGHYIIEDWDSGIISDGPYIGLEQVVTTAIERAVELNIGEFRIVRLTATGATAIMTKGLCG